MDDDEQVENSLADAWLVKNVLGMDLEQFERWKANAVKGLMKFGSSFDYHLGLLLRYSDLNNSTKILNIWRKECSEHEMLYRIWKAKDDALKANGDLKE